MAAMIPSPDKGKHKQTRSVPRIDMTPMVDLAFLLLTFFVMTTTLMKNYVMEIKQPVADETNPHTEIKAERVLNLVLAENDNVYWYMGMPGSDANRTNYSRTGLRKLLNEKKAAINGLYVFIKASDQSRYQNMVDVLDEMMITEINNYTLANLEAEDKNLVK